MFSFYPKADFSKRWKFLLPSIIIPGLLFIAWDEVFTRTGVWHFNPKYLSGVYIYSLPLEEVLFFVCIPYACVFTYFALNYLIKKDYLFLYQELITKAIILLLFMAGIYNIEKMYTSVTFILTGFFLAYQLFVLKPRYMGRFYFAFLFILLPFFVVNGILTGSFLDEPVVHYNDGENLGVRIGTIPVEDILYGLLLIASNITIFEWLQERHRESTLLKARV